MESIDKLREYGHECCARMDDTVHDLADEIEAEIAERYMELPLDADGVPIRPGDRLEYDYGDTSGTRTVVAIIYDGSRRADIDGGAWDFQFDDDEYGEDTRVVNSMRDFYSCNRHAKPRTLEDVLASYRFDAQSIYEDPRLNGNQRVDELEALDGKVAAEIRELMEVDA